MIKYKVITTLDEAEEYRDNLTADGLEYLYKVDKFIASIDFDEEIYLPKEVKPSNLDNFWQAFTYILFATGAGLSISEDALTVKLRQPMPAKDLFLVAL